MSTILELKSVDKSFNRTTVLRDINLTVAEGDFVSVIGFSGTGKSTLINIIAGLLTPDAGKAQMDGAEIKGPGPERGLVFQNYSLLPWLTVTGNVRLAVDQLFPDLSKKDRADRAASYIDMVKLSHAADKLPRELSGGMRQRVSVARTLAGNPRILLLDEPLSALDALTRATLQDEIIDIWQKNRTTVVWITNDPDEALLVGDRVIPLLPHNTGATLGNELSIPFTRPRDRRTLITTKEFKSFKLQLIDSLIAAKKDTSANTTKKMTPPDILPEDLLRVDSRTFMARKLPRRRSQIIKEEFKVDVS